MENTLLIRADADEAIGAGHVMRCLSLAQAWRDARRGPVWLAARTLPTSLRDRYQHEEVRVCMIEAGLAAFSCVLNDVRPRWVVLDGYDFGRDEQTAVRKAGSDLLVVDDDAAMGQYDAHLVVDPNVFAEAHVYSNRGFIGQLLLGPRYALLRKEMRTGNTPRPIEDKAEKLLVSFGGADRANLSLATIRALETIDVEGTVILGPANTHADQAERAAASSPNVRVIRDPGNMRQLMERVDLALVAAGGICLELAHVGVPQIVVSTSNNQSRVANGLVERGVARSMGDVAAATTETIRSHVVSLRADTAARRAMRARGPALVDGYGVERIVSAMARRDR